MPVNSADTALLTAEPSEEAVVMEDDLLTNEYHAARIEQTRRSLPAAGREDRVTEKAVLVFDGVDGRCMENAIAWVWETCGSVLDNIRRELMISDEEIALLKRKYLL